jgi:alginate O-acetyltransferase complex protein AlgI
MRFNSLIFLAFLLVVLALYYRSPHRRQNRLLLVASYVFYGWWDYRFLSLLVLSTTVAYYSAKKIAAARSNVPKRVWLILSLVVNLGCLGLFKYFDFFAESTIRLLGMFHLQADSPTIHFILPVGISFYTFQTLSYTVDVYQGRCRPAKRFADVALYVAFFPQLVAGPIERAVNLLPQIESKRNCTAEQVIDGVWLILLGYLKKLVIADRCAQLVAPAFSGTALPFDGAHSWLFLYAFAFQIYGDFSGYSDIARGVAKMLGIELMQNFARPYFVSNPSEFWRHWHISLSTWLRDYLYIPLGGSRGHKLLTLRNLMITMVLGGLWHGAGWAYLAWGLYHGVLLVVHRLLSGTVQVLGTLTRPWRVTTALWRVALVVVFFHLTCLGWLIFRTGAVSPGVNQIAFISDSIPALFARPDLEEAAPVVGVVLFAGILTFAAQWRYETFEALHKWRTRWQVTAVVCTLALITSLGVFEGADFIYFQF